MLLTTTFATLACERTLKVNKKKGHLRGESGKADISAAW